MLVATLYDAYRPKPEVTDHSEQQDVDGIEETKLNQSTTNKMTSFDDKSHRNNIDTKVKQADHVSARLSNQLLLSFSLYQNLPLIVNTSQPKGAIGCLNGLRVIAMCCVILGHTYVASFTLIGM